MKNIPFKYRGKSAHPYDDRIFEGSLLLRSYAPFIYGEDFCVKVDPNTIQKLAGEVYKSYKLKKSQIEGGLFEYTL